MRTLGVLVGIVVLAARAEAAGIAASFSHGNCPSVTFWEAAAYPPTTPTPPLLAAYTTIPKTSCTALSIDVTPGFLYRVSLRAFSADPATDPACAGGRPCPIASAWSTTLDGNGFLDVTVPGTLPTTTTTVPTTTVSTTTTRSTTTSTLVTTTTRSSTTSTRSTTSTIVPTTTSTTLLPPLLLSVLAGTNLTPLGTPIARVPNPTGGGNKNLEIIRDGDVPPVGTPDSSRQFDTFHGAGAAAPAAEDWIGYSYPTPHVFSRVVFQEGRHFVDGGWFDTLTVQVRQGGTWTPVAGLTITPAYPAGDNGVSFETYVLDFVPTLGDGIRIYGRPGGVDDFVSVAELQVGGF